MTAVLEGYGRLLLAAAVANLAAIAAYTTIAHLAWVGLP